MTGLARQRRWTARGIEFGTSPFDEGLRRSIEYAQSFGAATYRWVCARQRLSTKFTISLGAGGGVRGTASPD